MRSALTRLGRALLATLLTLLAVPATAAAADAPNPPWSGSCPQRLALVLDLSESMGPYLGEVRDSAADLVDALRGSPNLVSVITFGTAATVAVAPADVADDGDRQRVKDRISELDLLLGRRGATNWDAALAAAGAQQPDLVVFLTDGVPTARGNPATAGTGEDDPEHLAAAVRVSDELRARGTRVVGVGLGLVGVAATNLGRITGPVEGEDYHRATATALAAQLREIAASACGVAVAALPQPQGPPFPFGPAIGAGVAVLLAAALGGLLTHRRRTAEVTATPRARTVAAIPDPTLRTDDLPPPPPRRGSRPTGHHD